MGLTMTDEEILLAATSYHRNRLFAETVVTVPELVREALGKVFDLSAWEERAKRVGGLMAGIDDQMAYLRHAVDDLARQVGKLEERLDFANHQPQNLRFHKAQ
jgi:hypothetical protein